MTANSYGGLEEQCSSSCCFQSKSRNPWSPGGLQPRPKHSGEWAVAKECVRRSQPELAVLVASRSFDVYTDGSAPRGNPGGPVGFAAVFVAKGKRPVNLSTALAGRDQEPKTSNNRAEIAGVALALLAIAGLLAGGQPLPVS